MLEITDLYAGYGQIEAVRGLSLSVDPGRVTLLLGANGAGKSTTLRTVAGLHPPTSGTVVLNGVDVTGQPAHKMVRHGVSLVPEGRRVLAPMTVLENLRLGAYTADKAAYARTLAEVNAMFPILADRSNGAAGLLSGGEQQMLAFGRALMSQPKIMLLDEPDAHLDLHHQLNVFRLLERLNCERSISIVAVLNDLTAAASFCRRLALLNNGRLLRQGSPVDVVTTETIRQVYGADILVCRNPLTQKPMVAIAGSQGT